MGFNAATAVEPLDFDFTAYGGPQGVIPEPSTKQINDYFKGLKKIFSQTREMRDLLTDDLSDEEAEAIIAEKLGDSDSLESLTEELTQQMLSLTAELCSQTPNEGQIGALPWRVQRAFTQWLAEELRPNQEAPGTKGSSGAGPQSTTSRGRSSRTR